MYPQLPEGTGNYNYTNFSGWTQWDTRWKDIGVNWYPYKYYPSGHEKAGEPLGLTGQFFTRVEHNADQYNFLAGLVNSIDYVRPVTFTDHFPVFQPYNSGQHIVPKNCWNFETEYKINDLSTVTLTFDAGVTWDQIKAGILESGKDDNTYEHRGQAGALPIIDEDHFVSYLKYNVADDGSSSQSSWFIRYIQTTTGYQSSFMHSRYGSTYRGEYDAYNEGEGFPNWLYEYGRPNLGGSYGRHALLANGLQSGQLWHEHADRMGMTISTEDDMPLLNGQTVRAYLEETDLEIYNAVYDYTINAAGSQDGGTPIALSCDSAYGHKTGLGIFGSSGIADETAGAGTKSWKKYGSTQGGSTTGGWPGFTKIPYNIDYVGGGAANYSANKTWYAQTSQSFYAVKHSNSITSYTKTPIDPTAYITENLDNRGNYNVKGVPFQENKKFYYGNSDNRITASWWVVNKEKCINGKWEGLGYANQAACEAGEDGIDGKLWVDATSLPFTNNYSLSDTSFANGSNFMWGDFSSVDAAYKAHGMFGLGTSYNLEAPTGAGFLHSDGRRMTQSSWESDHAVYGGGDFFWGDMMLTCGRPGVSETITNTSCCPKWLSWGTLDGYRKPVEECWVNGSWVGKLGGINLGYEPYYNPLRDGYSSLNTDENKTKRKNLLINNPYQTYEQYSYLNFLNPSAYLMEDRSNPYHWNSYSPPPYKGSTNSLGFTSNAVEKLEWLKTEEITRVADEMGLPLNIGRMTVPYKFKHFTFDYSLMGKSFMESGWLIYYDRLMGYKHGNKQGTAYEGDQGAEAIRVAPNDTIHTHSDPAPSTWGSQFKVRQDFLQVGSPTAQHWQGDNKSHALDWQGYNAWYGYHWLSKDGYNASDFADYSFGHNKPDGAAPAGDDLKGMRKIGADVATTPEEKTLSSAQGYYPLVKEAGQWVIANDLSETEWIRPIPMGHYNNTVATNRGFGDFNLYASDFVKKKADSLLDAKLETVSTWSGNRFNGFYNSFLSEPDGMNDIGYTPWYNVTMEWLDIIRGYKATWYWGLSRFMDNPVLKVTPSEVDYKEHVASIILNTYPKRLYMQYLDSVNNGSGSAVLRHFQPDARFIARPENEESAEAISHLVGRSDDRFGSTIGGYSNWSSPLGHHGGLGDGEQHEAVSPANVVVSNIGYYTSGDYDYEGHWSVTHNPVPLIETEFLKREVKHHEGSADMANLLEDRADGSVSVSIDDVTKSYDVFFNSDPLYTDEIGRVEYGFYFNNGYKIVGSGLGDIAMHKHRTWNYEVPAKRQLTGDAGLPFQAIVAGEDDWAAHGPFPPHGEFPLEWSYP